MRIFVGKTTHDNMKRLLLLLAAALAAFSAQAQLYEHNHTTDTQLHTGFQMSGRIGDRWGLNWGEELYFGNNISEFQKVYSRLMVNYYLRPNLTLSPMVMHIASASGARTMIYDMNVIYTHRIDRWAITLRGGTRLQDKLYPTVGGSGQVWAAPEFQLRTHLGVAYKTNTRLEPFANIESFLLLNPASDTVLDHTRYTVGYYLPRVRSNVGVKVRIDPHSSLSLYWRYDHTQTKYLSYELADAPYCIVTNSNTTNFVGVFYNYAF